MIKEVQKAGYKARLVSKLSDTGAALLVILNSMRLLKTNSKR